eukprot:39633-Amphidinium_carterae.1
METSLMGCPAPTLSAVSGTSGVLMALGGDMTLGQARLTRQRTSDFRDHVIPEAKVEEGAIIKSALATPSGWGMILQLTLSGNGSLTTACWVHITMQ